MLILAIKAFVMLTLWALLLTPITTLRMQNNAI